MSANILSPEQIRRLDNLFADEPIHDCYLAWANTRDSHEALRAELAAVRQQLADALALIEVHEALHVITDWRGRAEAAEAALRETRQALECDHGDDVHWCYVEHEGETWNRCDSCGLMELWAGGTRFKQQIIAPHEWIALAAAGDADDTEGTQE